MVSKLSLDECRMLSLLSNIGGNWVDMDIFLAVEEELGRYGVLDGGLDALLLTIEKLWQGGLVEFMRITIMKHVGATNLFILDFVFNLRPLNKIRSPLYVLS